jgi:hypothetical protein
MNENQVIEAVGAYGQEAYPKRHQSSSPKESSGLTLCLPV